MAKRLRFSHRMGLSPVRDTLQIESIDRTLRNHLWNLLCDHYLVCDNPFDNWRNQPKQVANRHKMLHIHFFEETWREAPWNPDEYYKFLKEWFDSATWNQVYDLIEFVNLLLKSSDFGERLNRRLVLEHAGYRLVGGEIIPITSEAEVASVERAIASPADAVRTHIQEATRLLGNRDTVNFRNVVKESISAVEAACRITTGRPKATLADGLALLRGKSRLHPALEDAFKKLYGWSSDADGIRHALTEDAAPVDMETARFMLIAASAFAHYLLGPLNY